MILLGTDPEFFLKDGLGYVSAYGMFPGTKQFPYQVEKGAIQVDGMALEFNIDPAETEDEFVGNIRVVMAQLDEMIKDVGGGWLSKSFEPYAKFDSEMFILQPLEAKVLGCEPDFTPLGREKTPPDNLQDSPFRTAAGHMHLGWTKGVQPFGEEHFKECMRVARSCMDLPMFYPKTANEKRRAKYYGSGGSFRPKHYGAELRSPSNIWVERETTQREMYRNVRKRMAELGKE